MEKTKKVEDSKTIMTEMIMPDHTNPLNNLMGGNLMRWMDIAAGICAAKHAESHVVTASVDNISFHLPIPLGSVITITATVSRAFNTSLEVFCQVVTAEITGLNERTSNQAYLTFVAIDEETSKPTNVPQLIPQTALEKTLFKDAIKRRELRLLLAGRIKASEATEIKELFQN